MTLLLETKYNYVTNSFRDKLTIGGHNQRIVKKLKGSDHDGYPGYLSRVSESHDKTANQKSSYQISRESTHCTRQVARETNLSVTL